MLPLSARPRRSERFQVSALEARLTPRGWYLTGGIVVMTLVAALLGVEELYALAASSGAVLVSAAVWLRCRSRSHFTALTQVVPERTGAGTGARARLVLANSSQRRPTPLITVSVPLRLHSPWGNESAHEAADLASFVLPGLMPLAQAEVAFELPRLGRGLWAIGPATATISDPLGLTEKRWSGHEETYLVVHPKVPALAVLPLFASTIGVGSARRRVDRQRGEELYVLREYRDGDDVRHIHWRSTARWDRLIVRQDEAQNSYMVHIGLDLRAERQTPESLERALEAAAGIACMVLGQPAGEVRLTTTRGQRWGPGSSKEARYAVLDLLAVASVHHGDAATPLFGGRAELAVLVSPTEEAAQELLARESRGALRAVVVVLTNEAPSGGQPSVTLPTWRAPVPVTIVKAGHDLEGAWAAAVGPLSQGQRFAAWTSTANSSSVLQ
jgi:uncharacterized protein (DUF58 family)